MQQIDFRAVVIGGLAVEFCDRHDGELPLCLVVEGEGPLELGPRIVHERMLRAVADAFIARGGGQAYGTLPVDVDFAAVVDRHGARI
jgi:hypothetical protein